MAEVGIGLAREGRRAAWPPMVHGARASHAFNGSDGGGEEVDEQACLRQCEEEREGRERRYDAGRKRRELDEDGPDEGTEALRQRLERQAED